MIWQIIVTFAATILHIVMIISCKDYNSAKWNIALAICWAMATMLFVMPEVVK